MSVLYEGSWTCLKFIEVFHMNGPFSSNGLVGEPLAMYHLWG